MFEYLYNTLNVALWDIQKSGMFNAIFNVFEWTVFWYIFRNTLTNKVQIAFLWLITIGFTSISFFLGKPIFRLDYDNLILNCVLNFLPFLIYIFIKKAPKLIFLPAIMGILPLVNLEIANGFTGNLSIFRAFFNSGVLELNAGQNIYIDLGLALIKTIFWAAVVILFYEVNHQFFAYKSWRFDVELPIKKGTLTLNVIVFKTLIYWMVGSILITMVGNNSIPVFTNKVGLVLNGFGFFSFLAISSIYFRKYITLYFYNKCGHSNWLYTLFFIPFLDFVALLITLTIPFSISKKIINYKFTYRRLVGLVSIILFAYAAVCFFLNVKNIPSIEKDLKLGLTLSQIVLPVFSGIGLFIALKSNTFYRFLLAFLILLLPIVSLYLVPKIELSGKIELLVNTLSIYLHSALIIFFIYPILYFKQYLKLK
ncbi:hypothetical protein [Lacihabitans sp. LS3-19]|uniref:hypothetical protein n=1 Tax=Lacihabitans sp. LS3-19 TaxID=2487335 RepID=UPI0020CB7244|nr:hypothetical protein [Lacihabitans sp. LS3-19]